MSQTYRLTIGAKSWDLPWAGTAAGEVPFGITERMATDPSEINQLGVALATVRAVAPADLLDALRGMSTRDAIALLGPYMQWTPDGEEPLGESSGSEG